MAMAASLAACNVALWVLTWIAFRENPVLLGAAGLAYSLGLRHAFDADHIAAIDNVTCKLIQEGKSAVATGLFFSLGHSTVVVALSIAVALGSKALLGQAALFTGTLGTIGAGVSGLFLLAIAAANALLIIKIVRRSQLLQGGARVSSDALERELAARPRFLRPLGKLTKLIGASWQMYPLGLLFALGFDTATEIGLLGISASQGAAGAGFWTLLIFPALFAAGMSLMDTANGIVMVSTYGWALRRPTARIFYNLAITSISIVAALGIGAIELLGIVRDRLQPAGNFWVDVGQINDKFTLLGAALVALMVASGIVAAVVHRRGIAAR
jgi:high-affinity nickel-transport protein